MWEVVFVIYFIADTHFSEENIMRYENRPFSDVAEMNNELLMRWNSIVNQDDEIYILGDFGGRWSRENHIKSAKREKIPY